MENQSTATGYMYVMCVYVMCVYVKGLSYAMLIDIFDYIGFGQILVLCLCICVVFGINFVKDRDSTCSYSKGGWLGRDVTELVRMGVFQRKNGHGVQYLERLNS
jgi:hypothetical protein